MADKTNIEWTDATWNPITGCSIASPGCTHCYAMRLAGTRMRNHPSRAGLTVDTKAGPVWNGEVRFNEQWLLQPLDWSKPRLIFPCAHGDLFHENVPEEWIDKIFAVMALTPHHTYQPLTKRIERARAYLKDPSVEARINKWCDELAPAHWCRRELYDYSDGLPLKNVWVGTSVENQEWADKRIPMLLDTPAVVRWVSAEPLLGPIDFRALNPGAAQSLDALDGISRSPDYGFWPKIDWIVVGGESGPRARPMHPDWARSIRDQCAAASTAFTFKQWGEWGMPTDDLGALDWPYHRDHDRTHWFDSRECARPIKTGWSDKYKDGAGAVPPPPFSLWKTPEYLDQVGRCPQEECRDAGKCCGNKARSAVTWVGKSRAGRLLDGVTHDAFPAVRNG